MMVFFIGAVLGIILVRMILSKRFWLMMLGVILSAICAVYLSGRIGYLIGDRLHSCEPPPIEVFL